MGTFEFWPTAPGPQVPPKLLYVNLSNYRFVKNNLVEVSNEVVGATRMISTSIKN